MTEQPLLPPPDEVPEPVVATPHRVRRDLVPWLYGLGFLILAAAIFYLWQYPGIPGEPADQAAAIQAVEQHLTDIDARLTRLEQRPSPDMGKIAARLDALEGRVVDQSRLSGRVDTLSGRIESLSDRDQSGLDALRQKLDALAGQISAVESNAGSVDAIAKRLARLAKLQAASLALVAGRPVGDLPDAPEALARYEKVAPPTEAQLRLRFAKDEQAALSAKQPDENDAPLADRVWNRAQGLITIRRGNDVVIGDPTAVILSRAQAALDAGNLRGAVDAVESLKGPPAREMAGWTTDANGLLSARAALVDMADQS
jgi:hypothetical protein